MKGREALYIYSHNLICLQGPENCKSKTLLLTLLQVLGHHSCHRIKSSYILQPLMMELIYLLSSIQTQPLVNPIFTQIAHNFAIVKATKYSTICKKDFYNFTIRNSCHLYVIPFIVLIKTIMRGWKWNNICRKLCMLCRELLVSTLRQVTAPIVRLIFGQRFQIYYTQPR